MTNFNDPIRRIRRFNRAVTSEVGALDHSFLGRGRPLGQARVLHAIDHFSTDLSEIRHHLNLDKAVLSRALKALESEGLITLQTDAEDARKRSAHLTKAGAAEAAAYNALSDQQAETLLARHPQPAALLAAMDLVASALTAERLEIQEADPRSDVALFCLQSYYAELEARFERGFDVSLSADPEAHDMLPPRGAFYVALSDGLPQGCIGLKGTDKGYSEIKRLWVAPSARGLGLAQRLMGCCDSAARALDVSLLRLDTNSALPEAAALYRKLGWQEIDRFNDDPYPDLFFEKQL
ncbi:GNAT family N-acetyltransferase [Epibacterium sp. SM1969]|uniref:GNAT family N-acetyltransferase n=1 Tax=Tritonibacter aquimaris TaxID=2663379 RepID=A0A844ATG2_9RHOB|nr:GNAT family N-acetyltransferase [Tritonibacter aquimaris]MQY42618.1 GNAT family N-acetyltransferase [Tritonibacter aquimaris]